MLRTRSVRILLLCPFTFDLVNLFKVTTNPYLGKVESVYSLRKGILPGPIWPWPLTTLDLQTSSKVSAHPLSKDTLSEISAKLDQGERRTDRWAERRKDRLINTERLQREALTIFIIFFISAGNRFPTIQIYKGCYRPYFTKSKAGLELRSGRTEI